MNDTAYCAGCGVYYPEKEMHFQECPMGHDLLHPLHCQVCKRLLAFYMLTDDYITHESVVCVECAAGGEKLP